MKRLGLYLALPVLLLMAAPLPAATTLENFGTNSFTVDTNVTTVSFSQTADALVFDTSVALGDTLGGIFILELEPLDWSEYVTFGLLMSVNGTNPNLPFSVYFFDADFNINTYIGDTSSITLNPTVVMLSLAFDGDMNFSQVVGMQFTWDGGGAINASLSSVVGFELPTTGFFVARAAGGVGFLASSLEVDPAGAYISPGDSDWAALSDSNAKTDITAVDHHKVLEKIDSLPVTTWQYLHEPERPRIGPMAQDFRETFGLGFDDKHISTLDADGVTLAALKGLIEELQERKDRSAAQAQRLVELEAELQTLQEAIRTNLPPAE